MFGDLNQRLVNNVIIKFVALSSLTPVTCYCLSIKQTSFESKATAGSFSETVVSDPDRTAQRKGKMLSRVRPGSVLGTME